MDKLNLQLAKELIAAAEEEAKKMGVPLVIAVVDEGGNLVAFHRMDDSMLVSIEVAQNKAWTAVALKKPTADLKEASAPNGRLYGLNVTNQGKIVVLGGGIPLKKDGKVIGAIGVSGGTAEQDAQAAQAGVDVFNQK